MERTARPEPNICSQKWGRAHLWRWHRRCRFPAWFAAANTRLLRNRSPGRNHCGHKDKEQGGQQGGNRLEEQGLGQSWFAHSGRTPLAPGRPARISLIDSLQGLYVYSTEPDVSQEAVRFLYNTGRAGPLQDLELRLGRNGDAAIRCGTGIKHLFPLYLIDYSVEAGRRSGAEQRASPDRSQEPTP